MRICSTNSAALVTANWVSFGTFAALALIGIVDAHLRFVPGKVTTTPRPLPPDLDRWVRDEAKRLTSCPASDAAEPG